MQLLTHSEWDGTKQTLHLISQLLGKIRLQLAPPEPQWGHVSLPITVNGFTTGLLFEKEHVLQIDVNILMSRIEVSVDDRTHFISIEAGKSIKSYYDALFDKLQSEGVQVAINPKPQEMAFTGLLDTDETSLPYDVSQARLGLRLFQKAAHEQLVYLSQLRCRKVKPALFWGTFDVSSIIVYSREHPYPENKIIEHVAFDEAMVEFGFWPGDPMTERPSFFILPYPFLFKPLPQKTLKPDSAYYDPEKSEFFLHLEEWSSEKIQEFFSSSFEILMGEVGWDRHEYFFLPLKLEDETR